MASSSSHSPERAAPASPLEDSQAECHDDSFRSADVLAPNEVPPTSLDLSQGVLWHIIERPLCNLSFCSTADLATQVVSYVLHVRLIAVLRRVSRLWASIVLSQSAWSGSNVDGKDARCSPAGICPVSSRDP